MTPRVSHYFEMEDIITGGHTQSVKNQRKIMDRHGIEYTTEPDLEADVLHLNNMGPRSVYYARKARKRGVPVVIHAHQTAEDLRNSFAFTNILAYPLKPYLKYAYSLADRLICPSEHNKEVLEGYTDVEKTVISNGFDPEKIEGHEELRDEYLEKYDLEPPVVYSVGHVIKRKGLETFIETARRMPELDFVWFGYLNPVGEGVSSILQDRETVKMVKNSPDNCQFTGYIEDIRGAYAAGDIFFFPTRNENEGIALLESMGAGKPPVVRDISTFRWMEDGENCLKAEEDFVPQLEKLKDPEIRDEIGSNAYEKSKDFRLDSVGEKLVKVYEELSG
ncbi:MAG: glycosyltransferase family 4 protein [Candidatus Nanohaloarchaea archaeon]